MQEYFFVQNQSSHNSSSLIAPPSSSINFEPREKRAFEFFLHRAAPVLSGPLDAHLWCQLIPQLSQSEPIIRDAILAISYFYQYPSEHADARYPIEAQHQALKWYNRAIKGVKNRIQHDSNSSIALLSCLLFMCIEFQRNSATNALALYKTGFQMLSAVHDPSTIHEVVKPFFARHSLFSGIQGSVHLRDYESSTFEFSTLEDARSVLFALMGRCHDFIVFANKSNLLEDLKSQQRVWLLELNKWYFMFAKLQCRSSRELCASSNLLMYYNIALIWLSTKLSPSETAFDNYYQQFENVVHHAGIIIASHDHQPPFLFELGVLPPLYFVISKCRHPILRHKALALAKKAPARECLWIASDMVKNLERVMALEETSNGRFQEFPPTGREVPLLIEESKRIRHLEVVEVQPGGGTKTVIRASRYFKSLLGEEQTDRSI